jgi:hypothetical protein
VETKQFAEFSAAVVRSLPRDLDSSVAQGWITNQESLARVLAWALGTPTSYKLYRHRRQKEAEGWISGFDLEEHLKETGLIKRALSLESPLVKSWLEDPTTYPEEFKGKGKAVFLWGSQRTADDFRRVAYLVWVDGRVYVRWFWLGSRWNSDYPAVLANPSAL